MRFIKKVQKQPSMLAFYVWIIKKCSLHNVDKRLDGKTKGKNQAESAYDGAQKYWKT